MQHRRDFLSDRYLHFGLSSRRVEPKRQRSFHRHNEVELLLIERGGIDHLMGGRRERLRPGPLVVFWGAIPHAPLQIAPGTVLHRLTLPLAWFLEWKLPGPFTQAILSGEILIDRPAGVGRPGPGGRARPAGRAGPPYLSPPGPPGAADLAMFRRWHEDLAEGSADRRKLVLLECETRLRRLLLAVPAGEQGRRPPVAAPAARGSSQVERMSRFVALHYTEELRIADVARDAGLNPDYAAALFRRTCGLSLVDYVNEHRISHAQRLLATSDAKIVDVAYLAGFGSASRFYTAFKQACGDTPRRYRRRMGVAMPA